MSTSYAATPYQDTTTSDGIYAKLIKKKAYHRSPAELLQENGWIRGYAYTLPAVGKVFQMLQQEKNGHRLIDAFISGVVKEVNTTDEGIVIETENAQFLLKILEN